MRRDHEAIGKLADELLPALIAKLTASDLGEIEVRESGWKARLRKPARAGESRIVRPPAEPRKPSRPAADDRDGAVEKVAQTGPDYVAATSPAVGVFNPRRDLAAGMSIRSGDRLGFVDVLGVHQDVIAPIDGFIASSLVETGEAVEYGQELVQIESPRSGAARAAAEPASRGKK
jgi:biotin carboxyl carrier protein